jgi:hypothetical protein
MRNQPFIPNERGCYPDSPRLPRSSEVIKPRCYPERPGDPDDEGCFPESPASGARLLLNLVGLLAQAPQPQAPQPPARPARPR